MIPNLNYETLQLQTSPALRPTYTGRSIDEDVQLSVPFFFQKATSAVVINLEYRECIEISPGHDAAHLRHCSENRSTMGDTCCCGAGHEANSGRHLEVTAAHHDESTIVGGPQQNRSQQNGLSWAVLADNSAHTSCIT
jgi:hypothetical protein